MKTPDSYWTDPTADELVQRHRIHSGLFQQMPGMPTSTSRPQLGARMSSYEENLAVAPSLAREHIESLHQNSHAALLYGKNNVYLEPVMWSNRDPAAILYHSFLLYLQISNSNWTEWNTIQGVIVSDFKIARDWFEITSTITPPIVWHEVPLLIYHN